MSTGQPPSTLDPSLDVVYPTTWFPGAESAAQADVLTLAGGEDRQADFHLLPQAAATLSVPRSEVADGPVESRGWSGPIVFRTSGDAFPAPAGSMYSTPNSWEVGGLAPGSYQVRMPGANGSPAEVREIHVQGGGAVDLASAVTLLRVKLQFEGDAGDRPQVVLTDVDSGARYTTGGRQRDLGDLLSGRREDNQPSISVPAGRYRVSVATTGDTYLNGVSAEGAVMEAGGTVQIASQPAALTLRMAVGKAGLSGVAHRGATPSAGAMLLLVPALADAAGLADRITRTETNTDGSFALAAITPGPYIVVVLESGWSVNWRDQGTLAGYLMRGVPVDLKPGAKAKVDVVAAIP